MSHTRREMLKASLGASVLLSLDHTVPSFLSRTAGASVTRHASDETVLVVLQLSGGNDGLNTVVPYADDAYARNRSTLRLSAKDVHKIGDSLLGFHPRMQAFHRLFDAGHLSVVQGVGYPNSNRDHEAAMQDWHTAQPGQTNPQTGWLGRAVDVVCGDPAADVPAVSVGTIATPLILTAAKAVVPSVRSLEPLQLRTGPGSTDAHRRQLAKAAELPRAGVRNPLLDYVRSSTTTAYTKSKQVEEVTRRKTASGPYPSMRLAQALRTVAQLIRADLGIRIFLAEPSGGGLGGFDNHASQRDNHAALLHQLSESVAAFVNDLDRDGLLDRVLLMTFSEFGRTVAENGRRGTGHGAAAPVFLAGGKLRGGLIGERPSLTDLDNGAPKPHTDFRRLYATMLDSWLGFDSQAVLGKKYEPLDVLKA